MNKENIYFIQMNKNKTGFVFTKKTNFKDSFGWINNVITASGGIYVTEDKIDEGKRKIYKHVLKEAEYNLKQAQKEYNRLKNFILK